MLDIAFNQHWNSVIEWDISYDQIIGYIYSVCHVKTQTHAHTRARSARYVDCSLYFKNRVLAPPSLSLLTFVACHYHFQTVRTQIRPNVLSDLILIQLWLTEFKKPKLASVLKACSMRHMRRSRKFFQRGSVVLVDYGREDTITTIIGASSASQRNTIKMAYRR